jgi:3-deoxy-manno-octulosonate cytidylyltransferase (CMP-KDO synthetase)
VRSRIVIPARLASTRLPRKLLLCETGKSLIQHTYEAASRAMLPDSVIIAADHDEIANEVRRFGGQVRMTSPLCASGTDRVAEVARQMTDADVFVNVQGDEPEVSAAAIDAVVRLLEEHSDVPMATIANPIRTRSQLDDPACVKVVVNSRHRAMYFSRSMIPYPRSWDDAYLATQPPRFLQHVGLYAYRRDFLLAMAKLPPSALEKTESLEQLRVLEAGFPILVGIVEEKSTGIDTPQDYRAFVERCRRC